MAPYYRMRPANADDIFFIRALELDPANQYVHSWDEDTHRKKMVEPDFHYLIAEDVEGKSLGYAMLVYNTSSRLEWRRIIVAKRGVGLGTAFMRDVLAHFSRDQALKTIWLDVYTQNDRARHVYTTLGFREVGIDTTKVPGEKLVIMEYSPPRA